MDSAQESGRYSYRSHPRYIGWDNTTNDLTPTTNALPAALHGAYSEEPRWIDLRNTVDDHSFQRNPAFQDRAAELAATLHGCDKTELIGEELRQQHRWTRIRNTAVVLLTALSLLAVAASTLFYFQLGESRAEQRLSGARAMIAAAAAVRANDPHAALQLGAAAVTLDPGPETDDALLDTLTSTRYAGSMALPSGVDDAAFAPQGSLVATTGGPGVVLWDVHDHGHPRRLADPFDPTASALAFSPDARTIAVAGGGVGTVGLWDISDPAHPRREGTPVMGPTTAAQKLVFSHDGTLVAEASGKFVQLWDVRDPTTPRRLAAPLAMPVIILKGVAFGPGDRTLAVGDDDGNISLWNIGNRPQPQSS